MSVGFQTSLTNLAPRPKAIPGFVSRTHTCPTTTPHHRNLGPAAASRSSPGRASYSPDTSTLIPTLLASIHEQLASARRSWLDHCLDAPLVDEANNARVHVYGTVHFAPHGGPDGLYELQQLIDQVQPSLLAIEQPFDLAARAGLPYPEVLQQLSSLLPDGAELLTGREEVVAPFRRDSEHFGGAAAAAAATWDEAREVEVQRLRALLPGLAQPARVGRDLLDPFEVYGLYGGCDYVTRPSQLVEALALFGHLPGLEYAALIQAAEQLGAQVYSVDAPLRLQEKWVSQLVADFSLGEADLSRRLQHDLARAQSLLPREYHDWDMALADAVRQLELARASRRRSGAPGAGTAAGGGEGEGEGEGEPPLSTVTAFKVSRAVAAATIPYDKAQEAFGLQAQLQPLKYAVFARKAKHLLLQVRDLCQRMSVRQVRMDAASLKTVPPPGARSGGSEQAAGGMSSTGGSGSGSGGSNGSSGSSGGAKAPGERARAAWFDVGAQSEKVVLAVVGRQYVPYIEEMWVNERSALWHGDVPRTFAASSIERFGRP